jgi:hypothetical protein
MLLTYRVEKNERQRKNNEGVEGTSRGHEKCN